MNLHKNVRIMQKFTPELLIVLKVVYSCCFGFKGNLEFPDFLQKLFYNINYRTDRFFKKQM